MIINLISGPRNISTALMYSFAQREDTKVIDEPFYAYYLDHTGIDHPGREETLKSMSVIPSVILEGIHHLNEKNEIVFIKNMAHHHIGLDWSYLCEWQNVFLIRDPKQLIASFAQVIPNPTLQDIGLKEESTLLDHVLENGEHKPIVIDSNNILSDPDKGIKSLCQKLGITFDHNMLQWTPGPIPEDGSWAMHWYKNVHQSTGFAKQKTSERSLPRNCEELYYNALPYYEKLRKHI